MKTVYLKRLDGEIVTCPENTDVRFLCNGMVQVETPNLVYLTGRDHIEIIADEVGGTLGIINKGEITDYVEMGIFSIIFRYSTRILQSI